MAGAAHSGGRLWGRGDVHDKKRNAPLCGGKNELTNLCLKGYNSSVMKANGFIARTVRRLRSYGFNLILLCVPTGLFAGIVVTFYNICTSYGEGVAAKAYALLLANPAFIPLLFVVLFAGAILIGTLTKFVPMVKGSGIPQTEGAARGLFRIKWYAVMCSMFAGSLACVFLGLSAGSEGPSVQIGGCAGDAVSVALRRSYMMRRLQISAGASAGFAVAFNAPVTGMIFSVEEAFKSLSPSAFICSAISVICALFVRNSLRPLFGLSVGYSFEEFVFAEAGLADIGFVALGALIIALFAVAFYYAMFAAKKAFGKVTFWKGRGKYLFPFLIAGVFGLVTSYCIGGGHGFIDALATDGTGNISGISVMGLSVGASIAIIVLFRFISMISVMSVGVPCGVFVPMLAVGAGGGALLSLGFQNIGMSAQFSDYFVIICMAIFFTAFVRAPLTGICMIFELTGQFRNFLPAMIGITVAYIVSELCHLQPGYEKMLEQFIKAEGLDKHVRKVSLTVTVQPSSQADGSGLRKIIWPANGLVTQVIHADGSTEVPDGSSVLNAGDSIVFVCETDDEKQLKEYLDAIVAANPD